MGAFTLITFSRKGQLLNQEVLCPLCMAKAPRMLVTRTADDDPSPYRTRVEAVTNRACSDCGAKPEAV